MDATDRKLLNLLQAGFPLAPRPFAEIAAMIGLAENETIARTASLIESGAIRKIGPILDSRKLGYVSTLAALAVPENKIDPVAQIVNSFPGVTHNYLREIDTARGDCPRTPSDGRGLTPVHSPYNMWFTVHARDEQELRDVISEIERRAALKVTRFDATRLFKIAVQFQVEEIDED
jgi:DNA-binding Lrp family transcriptional regulator